MKKRIYIAGKITGESVNACIQKFASAAEDVFFKNEKGTEIIFPLMLPGIYFGISHKQAMKICLEALKDCTDIYMLADWQNSDGAREEHQFAQDNGINIIYER